jgi:hypothetical protein
MGFSSSKSSGTSRSGTQFDVDAFNEFLKAIHSTLGGPFTIGDLFQLSPRSQGLFTGEPMGPGRPGGGFNLGFGTPPSFLPPPPTAPSLPAPPPAGGTDTGTTPDLPVRGTQTGGGGITPPTTPPPPAWAGPPLPPAPGTGQAGADRPTTTTPPTTPAPTTTAKQFTMSDILPAWNDDPEKRMDVPRLFRQADLDPNGFTFEEFQDAVRRAKNFGFTGRSTGNFGKALSLLQNITTNIGTFGGGKGTGIF